MKDSLGQWSQNRRRLLGAATLVVLSALVVLAQWFSGARQRDLSLQQGWLALSSIERASAVDRPPLVAQAQARFSRAAGVVSLEPLAMVGLSVTERMIEVWDSPLPPPPSATACTDEDAASWLRMALERRQPGQALAWAGHPAVLRRRGSLGALLRFAEGWQRAATSQKAATRQPPEGR